MSVQEKNFFTILEQAGESGLKIKENVPDSVEELVEIAQSGTAKTDNGKPAIIIRTTQGRQFARLEEWPNDIILEIKEN